MRHIRPHEVYYPWLHSRMFHMVKHGDMGPFSLRHWTTTCFSHHMQSFTSRLSLNYSFVRNHETYLITVKLNTRFINLNHIPFPCKSSPNLSAAWWEFGVLNNVQNVWLSILYTSSLQTTDEQTMKLLWFETPSCSSVVTVINGFHLGQWINSLMFGHKNIAPTVSDVQKPLWKNLTSLTVTLSSMILTHPWSESLLVLETTQIIWKIETT